MEIMFLKAKFLRVLGRNFAVKCEPGSRRGRKDGKQKKPFSVDPHPDGGYVIFKNVSLFLAIPAICFLSVYVYKTHEEHEPPPFVKYEHMRIRTKRYPWGDGVRSLFHNPRINALPEGYEDLGEDEDEEDEKKAKKNGK